MYFYDSLNEIKHFLAFNFQGFREKMKYKKIMFMLVLAVFLLSITCVSASEIDDTLASEDTNTIGLSVDNDNIEDNLQTSEENEALASTDYDEAIAQTDTDVLGADSATFSDLAAEIIHSGNITLTHKNYTYDEGETITISEDNKVIDGNGAVIDMNGSTIRAFYISASGVTIKNLTIKNANYNDNGGAIYFDRSGTVTNCNFTDNSATVNGGAVYFWGQGTVTNCNFAGNTASGDGGAINMGTGTVSNCNFVDNKATGDSSYGGAVYFLHTGTVTNCNFTNNTASGDGGAVCFWNVGEVTNCNFTNNTADYAGAVYFQSNGTVTNCNFTDNSAYRGGAVYFYDEGTVTNCNFVDNKVAGDSSFGGAVYFYDEGTVTNCNFADNTAGDWGGAIMFVNTSTVSNCNFTGNNATNGSAIYFYSTSATKTVSNSRFLNNRANAEALEITKNDNNITITFTGGNNLLNAIYSSNDAEVTFNNVTYWGANGITTVSSTMSGSNKAAGQKITVGVVVNNKLVLSNVMVTDENGMIVLDINAGENYYISVHHDTDSYYTEAERTISNNTKFNVNVTSQTIHNKTVNITAKSNIPNDVVQGKLLFILPNGTQINANYAGNGTWWAVHTFDYGVYQVSASYYGLYDVTVKNATIAIKLKTELTSNAITTTYNINKNLVITLKDSTGKALSGVSVTVDLNGAKTYATDKNGQVKVSTKGLAPKAYTAKVTFNGNTKYAKSTKDIKVTVKKATPKMKAKKKTFKRTVKTKKYTIVLKDNTGKAMKKVKVTLKIKGKKTITVKTNSKGKATFKIKKLTKKGTYKSTVTFKGNKYYNKVVKKVKIKIK